MEIRVDRKLRSTYILSALALGTLAATLVYRTQAQSPGSGGKRQFLRQIRERFLNTYCIGCHSQKTHTAGLDLEQLTLSQSFGKGRSMGKSYRQTSAGLDASVRDASAGTRRLTTQSPLRLKIRWIRGGRRILILAVLARCSDLNRVEYGNAIRDLFALDVNVNALLPGDDTADGSFDNFADVLSISTAHLERYLSVARQVPGSRQDCRLGGPRSKPSRCQNSSSSVTA